MRKLGAKQTRRVKEKKLVAMHKVVRAPYTNTRSWLDAIELERKAEKMQNIEKYEFSRENSLNVIKSYILCKYNCINEESSLPLFSLHSTQKYIWNTIS